jgi:hypothetical protein
MATRRAAANERQHPTPADEASALASAAAGTTLVPEATDMAGREVARAMMLPELSGAGSPATVRQMELRRATGGRGSLGAAAEPMLPVMTETGPPTRWLRRRMRRGSILKPVPGERQRTVSKAIICSFRHPSVAPDLNYGSAAGRVPCPKGANILVTNRRHVPGDQRLNPLSVALAGTRPARYHSPFALTSRECPKLRSRIAVLMPT